jgi:hypothetical protein
MRNGNITRDSFFILFSLYMAFTRYHDDECRIIKQLQQQTDTQRWYLDVPGTGETPSFALDPHIIPQKWGGNLWTNRTDLHSTLLGLNVPLHKLDGINPDTKTLPTSRPNIYVTCEKLTTEQSRAIMPAWTARDLQQDRGHLLLYNPQVKAEIPFQNEVSTRLLEKKHFTGNVVKL